MLPKDILCQSQNILNRKCRSGGKRNEAVEARKIISVNMKFRLEKDNGNDNLVLTQNWVNSKALLMTRSDEEEALNQSRYRLTKNDCINAGSKTSLSRSSSCEGLLRCKHGLSGID